VASTMRQETITYVDGPTRKSGAHRKLTYLVKRKNESQDEFLDRLNHLGYGGGQLDKLPHHWSDDGLEYHPGEVSACRLCTERLLPVDVSIIIEKKLKTSKNGRVLLTVSMDHASWLELKEQIEDNDLLKTLHWFIDTPETIRAIRVPVSAAEVK